MYTYSRKHNKANGWNDTDGSDDNRSWNCGAEGETGNPKIVALRKKLAKNAMAVLLMSRGIPMFLAGDEFLNTQFGNNNAYCQDNEISWLNWHEKRENQDHWLFTRHMIALRKKHPIVRKPYGVAGCERRQGAQTGAYPEQTGAYPEQTGAYPDIQTLLPEEGNYVLRVLYAGRTEDKTRDDFVCLAVNVYWEEQMCQLPSLPDHYRWEIAADTSEWYLPNSIPDSGKVVYVKDERIRMDKRSVLVLVGVPY
jgi:glycogen operon protein